MAKAEGEKMQTTKKLIEPFPRIFRYVVGDERTVLHIVYRNKVETYELTRTDTKKRIDETNPDCHYDNEDIWGPGWNPYHECRMLKDNGFREVKPW